MIFNLTFDHGGLLILRPHVLGKQGFVASIDITEAGPRLQRLETSDSKAIWSFESWGLGFSSTLGFDRVIGVCCLAQRRPRHPRDPLVGGRGGISSDGT